MQGHCCLTNFRVTVNELLLVVVPLFSCCERDQEDPFFQSCPGDVSETQMIEFLTVDRHIGNDIPKAFSSSQPSHCHRTELGPAVERTEFLSSMMLLGQLIKFMSRKNLQQLMKDCATMCHGLDLLGFVMFSVKNIITQGALQAYSFRILNHLRDSSALTAATEFFCCNFLHYQSMK